MNRFERYITNPRTGDDAAPAPSGERSSSSNRFDSYVRSPEPTAAPAPAAPRTWWDTASSVGQTADDAVRAAADTLTFGTLDRVLGEEEIRKTLAARARSPVATIAGDVVGSVGMMAAAPLRAIGAGAAALMGGGRAGVRGVVGRAAGYGAEGAAFGGAQAAGHTYDWESLPGNVAQGAAIGGAGGAITGPFTPRASVTPRPNATVPTQQELRDIAGQQYRAGRTNPGDVHYSSGGLGDEVNRIRTELYEDGFNEVTSPATFRGLGNVDRAQRQASRMGGEATFTPGNIESIRKSVGRAADREDIAAATIAKERLDAFTANPSAGALSSGSPGAARATNEMFETARSNAAAQIRSRTLRDTEREVDLRSATRNSGLNFENNMRSAIAKILISEGRGFSAAEREALEQLARRTDIWNNVRSASNFLGGGGGLGALVTGGAGAGVGGYYSGGDPSSVLMATVAPIVAGRALRGASNRSMRRAVNEMDEIIRSRSPEFARRQAQTPGTTQGPGMNVGALAARNAIIEHLIRLEQQQQPDSRR